LWTWQICRVDSASAVRAPLETTGKGTPAGIGLSPVNPMNSPDSTTSSAHNPRPTLANRPSIRSTSASLSARVAGAGKYRITSGSAFISANGSRSSARHRRIRSRSVRGSITRTGDVDMAQIV